MPRHHCSVESHTALKLDPEIRSKAYFVGIQKLRVSGLVLFNCNVCHSTLALPLDKNPWPHSVRVGLNTD